MVKARYRCLDIDLGLRHASKIPQSIKPEQISTAEVLPPGERRVRE